MQQMGVDMGSDTDEMGSQEALEAHFSQMRTDEKIEATRLLLQGLMRSDTSGKKVEKTPSVGQKEIVYVAGPISMDLNLIFREADGALRLEEADLMAGGTGLKAIAASRFGVRAKFIAMARDPMMRELFERWSVPIGSTSMAETGPSRIVPHISVIREKPTAAPLHPTILAPQISVHPREGTAFLEHIDQSLPPSEDQPPLFVSFNGRHTFPGLEPSYYTSLMKLLERKGYRAVADMRLGMPEQEMLAIYEGSPWMVKPNLDEFLKLYRFLYPEILIPHSLTKDDIGRMGADIARRFCINVLAITTGKEGAVLVVRRPKLKGVVADAQHIQEVSPVGCGDAFTGTFLGQFLEHGDYNISLRFAIAAGTETAKLIGTKIAERDDIDRSAAHLRDLQMTREVDGLDESSYLCERLMQDRGYVINSSTERGGSSMQTFFATRRSDGASCVIKYSDWEGVSSDGIPWLLGQAVKLRSIQQDSTVPTDLKNLYPKVLEVFQGQQVAYYVMEQFRGAQDLARHYLDSPEIGAQEMFQELKQVSIRLVDAYREKGLESKEGEIDFNVLTRAEKRLGMLANKSDSQVYRRLVQGKPFVLGPLQYKDAGHFFEELMQADTLKVNGAVYKNLPHLLKIMRDALAQIQERTGPTHFCDLTHGDLSIRNFLKCPDGQLKIIDVRSPTRIHNVTPVSTSVEYDFAKIFYSPFMELVRNEFCLIDADDGWNAEQPSFQFTFRSHPTVDRFLGLRRLLHEHFADTDMRHQLKISHPAWHLIPQFGEALNYASDAVHRLSQDPSGKHSLMYYLEATRQLSGLLENQDLLPHSPAQS